MSYTELPNVPGTAESRISALKEARELLKGDPKVTSPAIFGGGATEPGKVAGPYELISLATYIETGHDYSDLHPVGKARPKIVHQHVTVVAGGAPSKEDIEHLLHHVENGDFAEFMNDMIREAEAAANQSAEGDSEESAESGDTESK
jgi:hypothetical protein